MGIEETGESHVFRVIEHSPADGPVITLIDEIHTPDSSRYWVKSSYEKRMAEGLVRFYLTSQAHFSLAT
jgi:phosphoribosylaminoimidazole-succinocarboxamide synthase